MKSKGKILIVDDEPINLEFFDVMLSNLGFRIEKAADGEEALQKVVATDPDLIILDVMMTTDTEGFSLAYKLRNNPDYRQIPIIMVTGFTKKMAEEGPEKFQHVMGESWPVTHLLEKPIDPEELLSVIEDVLRETAKE